MQEYRVIIPEEYIRIVEFIQEENRGYAEINISLKEFEPKIVFAWHFSIMIDCKEVDPDGLPTENELKVLDSFQTYLSEITLGTDPAKPNAIFLARIDWKSTRELIWRVYNPESIQHKLKAILGTDIPPRPFDYRIDPDNEWKLAQ